MTYQDDFINEIAPFIVSWRDYLGFGVASAIIAQACLESAYGRSDKANYNNFFGLKAKPGRVTCNNGTFTATSAEQLPDGSYITITTDWYSFADMNTGVQGYYQFIATGKYNVLDITDPESYLNALKAGGYATSQKYVDNCMRIVHDYGLTKYDKGGTMIPDSALVRSDHVMPSPNFTAKRKYKVDTVIIHCMAGTYDAKRCGELFADPKRQASSHYGISSNGDIWQYVPESARAWTTGGDKKANGWTGSDYDHRSITIEVSNITLQPWYAISGEAMQALIALCTDICRRYNINPTWTGNPKDVGDPIKASFVAHRFFATKSCPGNFIFACMPAIVQAIANNLNTSSYIYNGLDYSPVFDPKYYSWRYSDLKEAFGDNAAALWNHFTLFGMNEFRQASAEFDPVYYKNKYPDVASVCGDDNQMYYYHYVAYGKAEGRQGHA